MDEDRLKQLKASLDAIHIWPSVYMYKFIMEKDDQKLKDLKLVFGESVEFIVRESSGGKYISLTVKEMMLCADDIFNRYREVSKFKGIISL